MYELRWPRLLKIFDRKERPWTEGGDSVTAIVPPNLADTSARCFCTHQARPRVSRLQHRAHSSATHVARGRLYPRSLAVTQHRRRRRPGHLTDAETSTASRNAPLIRPDCAETLSSVARTCGRSRYAPKSVPANLPAGRSKVFADTSSAGRPARAAVSSAACPKLSSGRR